MFAPILAFTCDEIWLTMPHRASDDGRNVLLNEMSKPYTAYALSEDEMTKWARIAAVRNVVNGALEQARADKTIGKSLEAEVDLVVPHEDVFLAEMDPAALADTLLVSQVRVAEGDELSVEVRPRTAASAAAAGRCCPPSAPTPRTPTSARAAPPSWRSCPSLRNIPLSRPGISPRTGASGVRKILRAGRKKMLAFSGKSV